MFWDEGPGTATPPGQWNVIAETVVSQKNNSLIDNARLFALLNMALADSGIATWECKFRYNSLRPETAIREPQKTKNTDIETDDSWTSLITCPHSPEYVSGNSAYSAAAAQVLSDLLGDNTSFTVGSDAKPGVTRSYTSFSEAANEAGRSRIYGGVLSKSGNESGEQLGRDVANYVVENFLVVPDDRNRNVSVKNFFLWSSLFCRLLHNRLWRSHSMTARNPLQLWRRAKQTSHVMRCKRNLFQPFSQSWNDCAT